MCLLHCGLRFLANQNMPRIPIFKLGSSQDYPPPRLSSYIPALSLETLQLGIDNVRHDVWLSSEFTRVAGDHIAKLITKYGNIESLAHGMRRHYALDLADHCSGPFEHRAISRRGGKKMRRRNSGIVRTVAKTAVVAGTATATVGAVSHAMGGGKQPPAQPPAAAPAPPPQVAAPTSMTQDQIDRLKQLSQLRDSGVLTDAEFQAEKQRILGS